MFAAMGARTSATQECLLAIWVFEGSGYSDTPHGRSLGVLRRRMWQSTTLTPEGGVPADRKGRRTTPKRRQL